jgi:hypothetical protein
MISQERVAIAIAEQHGISLPEAARIARAAANRHSSSSPRPATAVPVSYTPLSPPRTVTRDELARAIALVSSVPMSDASLIADGVLAHFALGR